MYTLVGLRLKNIEARARLIELLIAETTAGELVKVLARIDATFHGRQDSPRGLHANVRVANTLGSISLSDASFILKA